MNLTNQQLTFARVQLEAAANATSTLSRRAHWQASVAQLVLALECYAGELQGLYGLKSPLSVGAELFSTLVRDAQHAGKVCVEAEQLASLEKDRTSWLSRLWQWQNNLPRLAMSTSRRSVLAETSLTEAEKQRSAGIDIIDVSEQEVDSLGFSEQRLKDTLNMFSSLVERQRSDGAEF